MARWWKYVWNDPVWSKVIGGLITPVLAIWAAAVVRVVSPDTLFKVFRVPVWMMVLCAAIFAGVIGILAVRRPLVDSQLSRAGESPRWLRLTEEQIDKLSAIMKTLGELKMLVLPRGIPDCEDLADELVAVASRAGCSAPRRGAELTQASASRMGYSCTLHRMKA